MKTIIFCNQKGGVGKTTLCRNLGWYFAKDLRVLFIDLDPQGNLTKSFVDENDLSGGLYDALTDGAVSIHRLTESLYLLGGDGRLALLEKQLVTEMDGYLRLHHLVTSLKDHYDLIFIDGPPSLGMLTANGLAAADTLVIPMNPSLFSMQGTNDLLSIVAKVKKTLNADLGILGFIINSYDPVPVITRQIREEICDAFGERVFRTLVSKSIKIEESIVQQCGISDLSGRGVEKIQTEIAALAEELQHRLTFETMVTSNANGH